MPIVSEESVRQIEEQIRTEAEPYGSSLTLKLSGSPGNWTLEIDTLDRKPYKGQYADFGIKPKTTARYAWQTLLDMGNQWKKSGFMEGKKPEGDRLSEADVNLKVEFPSHSVRDVLDKLYDKFTAYHKLVQQVARTDKSKIRHLRLVEKALGIFVNLLSGIKDAERSLY